MRKVIVAVVLLLMAATLWTLSAQYTIEGWSIKRAWGPLRSAYIDPQTRELRMVFEDSAGTIRIATVDPGAKTAVPVAEFKRQ